MVFFLFVLLVLSTGALAQEEETVPVDMASDWLRRDWHQCADPSQLLQADGIMTLQSNNSAVLYWQIPTRSGQPMDIDRTLKWVQTCDRPPTSLAKQIKKKDGASQHLLDGSKYRYLSWHWQVDGTIDDTHTIDAKGKIQSKGDDFAAKLGIAFLKKGSDDLREIAYVWTRSLPEESVLVQERSIVFWKFRYYRIVAESGEKNLNSWVGEVRDLYADYKRIYPNEEPGPIVRIYLMTDSDNTAGQVTGSFSKIKLHKKKPNGYVQKKSPSGASQP